MRDTVSCSDSSLDICTAWHRLTPRNEMLCLSALLIKDHGGSALYRVRQYRSGNNGHVELFRRAYDRSVEWGETT